MKTLGVTGGIGSGKTTVCRIFEELGARVFYADDEAKHLMQDDDGVRADLVEAFGAESFLPEGDLNRAYLANHVFNQPDALRKISHIVHPRVFDAFARARDQAEQDGIPLMIKEAAILFESGGDRHVDAVAVVDAPEEDRLQRVVRRDDTTRDAVLSRMQNQWPAERLRERADFVIDNRADRNELREQVEWIFAEMTSS